jgi:hypothetical protein
MDFSADATTVQIFSLTGVVLLWLLVTHLGGGAEGAGEQDNPRRLFHNLCQSYRLRWGERRLLWRIAREQEIDDPARLFLEPERFDQAMTDAMPSYRAQLRALKEQIFAGAGEKNPAIV